MTHINIGAIFLLCLVYISSTEKQKLDFGAINSHLKKLCLSNPENYIKDPGVVKCNILYDIACWKETPAGQTVVQPCSLLLFSTKDDMSRRCDEEGNWQEIDITKCHRLTPKEAVDKGKQLSNIPTEKKDDSVTHAQRVQRVYVALSWVEFFVLLPTFIFMCIVMSRKNDRFTLHKNLILAFLLRLITLFIYYYEKMGEKDSNTAVCNAFWLLNRYFAASEITWMLNEGVFLLRMLAYPFDSESYLWYYYLFGWGFSGVLTFCVYLPYMQFKISTVSSSCWARYSHSQHMLVLYVPLTIMLLINFGVAVYVIRMLTKKLKNSHSSQMNAIKKSAKAVVVLISVLGVIYLLTFYQPGNNPSYDYFVAVGYPLQGVMVCIFCVYLSVEFREALKRHWMKWRYGILIETNPYSASAGHDNEAGPSGEQEGTTTGSIVRTESLEEVPPRALSIASLRDKSSDQFPEERVQKRSTERTLLSRSSDLTKFRLAKVEPEPVVPLRVQSAGRRDWCPPTLQAVKAWTVVEISEKPDESNQGLSNEGFFGSEVSLGSKASLDPTKPATTEEMESHAPSEAELQTDTNADPEEAEQPNNVTPDDAREVSTSQQSEEQFSMFSSQEFELDAESAKKSLASTPLPDTEPARDNETLTATAGASFSQDAQPSTSTDQANASAQGKTFWDKARQLASQRRRSRMEHSRVMSTEGDSLQFRPTNMDRFKEAEEYRLAWITKLLRGTKSRENESDV